MGSLKMLERRAFEDLFGMADGYVLDFTNRTFYEFMRESAAVDIYSDKYMANGESKAKRLRAFLEVEDDPVISKTLADLMEYWRQQTPRPSSPQLTLATRAEEAVKRLKCASGADDEFLKRNFGVPSFDKLQIAQDLSTILEARFAEAARCLSANAPLAVIFHCGAILEGLLLGLGVREPKRFYQATKSPKDKSGAVKKLHEWKLAQLIEVACELGYLGHDVEKFGHALRDFRNYIHPNLQLNSGFNPDKHTAEICLQVLKAAVASLSGDRR